MNGYTIGEAETFEGVVIGSRYGRNATEYTLYTEEGKLSFFSDATIAKGAEVVVEGKITSLFPLCVNANSISEREGVYEKVISSIEKNTQLKDFLFENELTKKLGDKFYAIAKRLYSARELNRFVLLRFHNDADGVAGAMALNDFLNFRAVQQNSAVYQQREVVNDVGTFYYEKKPLVILLDFGSNSKSAKQLELLRAAGAEIILIDHHPIENDIFSIPHFLLSPWLIDGLENPSSYTAGYLAAEVAKILGVDSAKYARIACAGDKSKLFEVSEDDRAAALVLDYLAGHSRYGNNLAFYKGVLTRSDLFNSILTQARESINEAVEKANARLKKIEKGEITIYVLPLSNIVKKGEFPNSSKIVSAILESVNEDKPIVVIGYREAAIILRANKKANEKGIDFSKLIAKLNLRFNDFIYSGGGHALAAAIHTQKGYEQSLLNALVEEL